VAWAGYLYTTYQRDLVRDRPTGVPRRPREQIIGEVERSIEFYHLQVRRRLAGRGRLQRRAGVAEQEPARTLGRF